MTKHQAIAAYWQAFRKDLREKYDGRPEQRKHRQRADDVGNVAILARESDERYD